MNCIIVDDEMHCIGTLEIMLQKLFPDIHIMETCLNGLEGIDAIERHQPDFIFLDISMPKMNGFDMLSKIENPTFKVIFTTAYDNFAIKAFKVSAVDYLLKPINAKELTAAVQKVRCRIMNPRENNSHSFLKEQLSLFLENIQNKVRVFPNIAIPTMEGMEMMKTERIIYVESDSNYSKLYFHDESHILTTKTLKEMEKVLAKYNFVRIHRSFLININHLKKYVKGVGGYVIMNNGKTLDVARRKKDDLLDRIKMS